MHRPPTSKEYPPILYRLLKPLQMDIETIAPNPAADTAATTSDKKVDLMIRDLLKAPSDSLQNDAAMSQMLRNLAAKYKMVHVPSKWNLGMRYRVLNTENPTLYPIQEALATALVKKSVRSTSGILNISVSLPPDRFSCKYNCHFCPNEPGMPRSYLSNEDVFKRAAEVDFDTVKQVYIRLQALERNGHTIDKLEFRVLGGTFSCYERPVADTFIRDLYYGANTYYGDRSRPKGSIEEEQSLNVSSPVHVVGLGVETRPDEITPNEIVRFRRYGITRVEIGVQHTDDNLLRKVNRGHLTAHSRRAIKLLKDYGFKVEIHIMADLPGATPEGDKECYKQVLQTDPDLIPDYLKDYPCLDVDFTKIKEWKASGKWTPYAERTPDAADLKDVLVYRQEITPPWVRVNRIQRDFQEAKEGRLGYTSDCIKTNLAQIVKKEAEAKGIYCQCIRCCELRDQTFNPRNIQYRVASFPASDGLEYFISANIPQPNKPRDILLGFIRLRISPALHNSIIPELQGKTAMIRELHVYGSMTAVGQEAKKGAQHIGIGKELLRIAEANARKHGCDQIAIISGIGVRGYYQKRGYELRGSYMMKDLSASIPWDDVYHLLYLIIFMTAVWELCSLLCGI
jgi:ELP3 family radical SAM enzyme/protein acetyltransferase